MFKISVNYKVNENECIKEVYEIKNYFEFEYQYQEILNIWLEKICPHINFYQFIRKIRIDRINSNKTIRERKNELKIMLINDMIIYLDKLDEECEGKKLTEETKRKFEITVEEI